MYENERFGGSLKYEVVMEWGGTLNAKKLLVTSRYAEFGKSDLPSFISMALRTHLYGAENEKANQICGLDSRGIFSGW